MANSAKLSINGGNITTMKWYGGSIVSNATILGDVDASTGYKIIDGTSVKFFGNVSLSNSDIEVSFLFIIPYGLINHLHLIVSLPMELS